MTYFNKTNAVVVLLSICLISPVGMKSISYADDTAAGYFGSSNAETDGGDKAGKPADKEKPKKKTDSELNHLLADKIPAGKYIFLKHARERLIDRNI
ncbi:MAG: hypothetical protein HY072_04970, partial [Deltaproteobacteria bacterium]|nr:hypothetical protein [Deltaproteobacteria bacterium]